MEDANGLRHCAREAELQSKTRWGSRSRPFHIPIPVFSRPVTAVQGAILNCLGEVRYSEIFRPLEVRNCSRNLQDAIVGPCGESLLLHGPLQQPFRVGA